MLEPASRAEVRAPHAGTLNTGGRVAALGVSRGAGPCRDQRYRSASRHCLRGAAAARLVALVIMRGQHVLVSRGYGLADRAAGLSATDSTIYPVGSLSKQFTAAAIMRLVEDGRVKLDDPLARYFPGMALARDTTLRIEHLLRQTSGIEAWDDYPELQGIEATRDSGQFPPSRIIQLIGARPVLFAPGAWWSYSNANFTLLAGVIERVTGLTYDQYLQQSLLVPLHLRSTASCSPQDPLATDGRRAVGYHVVADSLAVRVMFAYVEPGMRGAGGLCSSAQDLARRMRALIGRTESQVANDDG